MQPLVLESREIDTKVNIESNGIKDQEKKILYFDRQLIEIY